MRWTTEQLKGHPNFGKLVRVDEKSLNENRVSNLAALPDAEQRQRKKTLASSGERKTQGSGLPHCCFTLYRQKLLDVDAKYASVKDLLDSLAYAGIIRGDKEGQITLEVNQVKVKKEFERTDIEIKEAE